MRRLLSRHVDPNDVVVLRRLVYTFNALVADRWRDRRVLLAGDAAHMTPQFVGQGMNAGIRDADNLSWKLQAILRHGADPAILDSYQTERAPHAKAMIDFSVFNKSLVSVKHPAKAKARDAAMWAAMRTPGLGGWVRNMGMKPKPRYPKGAYLGLPRGLRGVEGTLAPQADGPDLRRPAGPPRRRARHRLGRDRHRRRPPSRARQGRRDVAAGRGDVRHPLRCRRAAAGQGRGRTLPRRGVVDLEDTTGALTGWLRRAGATRARCWCCVRTSSCSVSRRTGRRADDGPWSPSSASSSPAYCAQPPPTGPLACRAQEPPDDDRRTLGRSRDAADRLRAAARDRHPVRPVRDLIGATDVEAAYAVQRRADARAGWRPGARVVGRKIGLTSPAVQEQLGVDRPDFGVLFDDMAGGRRRDGPDGRGCCSPRSRRRSPSSSAPTSTARSRRARCARRSTTPSSALEIVDSRIAGWDITFADTVADNASSGLFVLGARRLTLADFEPRDTAMTHVRRRRARLHRHRRGVPRRPAARRWPGSPATARDLGDPLRAGQVVLSGALGPMVPVRPGTQVRAELTHQRRPPARHRHRPTSPRRARMSRTKVAVIGSGNIGTDLMIKVLRLSDTLEMAAMVGIDPDSDGLARARRLGVPTTPEGVDGLIAMPGFDEIEIVFDATSAGAHRANAAALAPYGKRLVDLTPAAHRAVRRAGGEPRRAPRRAATSTW